MRRVQDHDDPRAPRGIVQAAAWFGPVARGRALSR
jgi:hypothetical protein